MANMDKVLIKETTLINIANTIRSKTGKTSKFLPNEMINEILNIGGDWSVFGYKGFPDWLIKEYNDTLEFSKINEFSSSDLGKYARTLLIYDNKNMLYESRSNLFKNYNTLREIKNINIAAKQSGTNMSSAFYEKTELIKVENMINNGNYKCTDVSSMFYGCYSLISAKNINLNNVTNVFSMFYNCTGLKEVTLFNTNSLKSLNMMFQNCISLVTIDFFDISAADNLYAMFNNCQKLENVPVFNIPNASIVNSMFSNCYNLTDQSLDNILQMCITGTKVGNKKLTEVGINHTHFYPASRIQALPHYQDFLNAGWTIGY